MPLRNPTPLFVLHWVHSSHQLLVLLLFTAFKQSTGQTDTLQPLEDGTYPKQSAHSIQIHRFSQSLGSVCQMQSLPDTVWVATPLHGGSCQHIYHAALAQSQFCTLKVCGWLSEFVCTAWLFSSSAAAYYAFGKCLLALTTVVAANITTMG